jgi:hypothetical protein
MSLDKWQFLDKWLYHDRLGDGRFNRLTSSRLWERRYTLQKRRERFHFEPLDKLTCNRDAVLSGLAFLSVVRRDPIPSMHALSSLPWHASVCYGSWTLLLASRDGLYECSFQILEYLARKREPHCRRPLS